MRPLWYTRARSLWTVASPWDWALLLTRLAINDERDEVIGLYAKAFDQIECEARRCEAVLRQVQQDVTWERDETGGQQMEVFRHPRITLARGSGDCDDSARLVRAVLRRLGTDANLVFVGTHDAPEHVATCANVNGQRIWLDASSDYPMGFNPYVVRSRQYG